MEFSIVSSSVFSSVTDMFYFGDLSAMPKKVFADSTCFTFGIMRERSTDEDVINSFLNVNFTGTPMSREHIEYVRSLKNKIEK